MKYFSSLVFSVFEWLDIPIKLIDLVFSKLLFFFELFLYYDVFKLF